MSEHTHIVFCRSPFFYSSPHPVCYWSHDYWQWVGQRKLHRGRRNPHSSGSWNNHYNHKYVHIHMVHSKWVCELHTYHWFTKWESDIHVTECEWACGRVTKHKSNKAALLLSDTESFHHGIDGSDTFPPVCLFLEQIHIPLQLTVAGWGVDVWAGHTMASWKVLSV